MSACLKLIGFLTGIILWVTSICGLGAAQNSDLPAVNWSETGNPYIKNFNPKEYGESPQNWAVLQDDRGTMYFANTHGLLIFDGVHWRLIKIAEGLITRSLSLLDGVVYVGANSELGYLGSDSEDKLVFHSLKHKIPEKYRNFNDVWNTLTVGDAIYFVTPEYIFRYADEQFTVWESVSGFHTAFSVRGQFYVKEIDAGLKQIIDDSLQLVPRGSFFTEKRIYAMLPYDESRILIGIRDIGFYLFDDESLYPFKTDADEYLQEHQLYHGTELSNDLFAFATLRGGVVILDKNGEFCKILNKTTGLRDDRVYYLYADRERGLWLAMDNGLARADIPARLSRFTAESGLESSVESIIRHRNILYAATHIGIFYLEPGTGSEQMPFFKPVEGPISFVWDFINAEDYLLAAAEQGVFKIRDKQAALINTGWINTRSLHRSRQDTNLIFVGLMDGLAVLQYKNGEWYDLGLQSNLNQEIVSIEEDENGNLWLGTQSEGVIRLEIEYHGDTFQITKMETFAADAGLPYNMPVRPVEIDNKILFATQKGLRRYDQTTNQFISDNTLGSLLADTTTWIYHIFSGQNDEFWVIAGDENRVINGKVVKRSDGNPELEETPFLRMNDMGDMLFIYPENGTAWFGGSEGIARYTESIAKDYSTKFTALTRQISGIGADTVFYYGDNQNHPRPIIDYNNNSLRFEYAGLSYEELSGNQYQVKLEGFDSDWSAWTADSRKDYTGLREGTYTFRVRAKNIYDKISEEDQFSFTVLPPWYRSWWAYLFYVTLFLSTILFAGLLQRNRLIKKEHEHTRIALLEAEHERKTEELEKARHLQLSMLPKVIPVLPYLDIQTYISTATEVGGDYYDLYKCPDDTLTIAIGDATGHGLNAGMMVTATKSLFTTLADEPNLVDLFQKMNHSLRGMNFRMLYMALQVVKINRSKIKICSAGMPPVMIYRKTGKTIEKILLKGLPLGNGANFPYQQIDTCISEGDTVLMMSDGLYELFNKQGEVFGYENVKREFLSAVHQKPEQIIKHLVHEAEKWRDGQPQSDDITLIVIKVISNDTERAC